MSARQSVDVLACDADAAELSPEPLDLPARCVLLRDRLTALRPLVVADLTHVFLEVASIPSDHGIRSLEFMFDEDDGRVARLEACFAKPGAPIGEGDELPGFEVWILLPSVLPESTFEQVGATASITGEASADKSLRARFERVLAEFGAYCKIASLEARTVDIVLR